MALRIMEINLPILCSVYGNSNLWHLKGISANIDIKRLRTNQKHRKESWTAITGYCVATRVILRLILMPGLQSGPKGVSEGQRVRVLPTAHSAPEGHLYVKQRGLIIMLVERERNTRSAKVDLILSRPRVTAVSRQMET